MKRASNNIQRSVGQVINKYHIGDSRRLNELLPNRQFVDVTVTSPPYWNLKDYEIKSQIGFGQRYEDYLTDLEKVFESVHEVTNERGSLWVVSDTLKHKGEVKLLPFDLAQRLQRMGWILQDIIIWNKDKTLPWSHKGKLRNIFEYIAFFSKSRKFNYHLGRVREIDQLREWWVRYPERYSPEGKAPARVWNTPIPRQGSWSNNWVRHFNPLPPELVRRILLLTTNEGDVVLDPFAGSGIVLAVAHEMRRDYLGVDLKPTYESMFRKTVLPAIHNMYQTAPEEEIKARKQSKRFSKLIWSLRMTKYPKEIIRLYREVHGSIGLEAVHVCRGSSRNSIEIAFLFRHPNPVPPSFLERVRNLSKKPPLSKYGLQVGLTSRTFDALSKGCFRGKTPNACKALYVYTGGRTYAWAQRITLSELLELMKGEQWSEFSTGRYPPIISDVNVKLDPRSPIIAREEG